MPHRGGSRGASRGRGQYDSSPKTVNHANRAPSRGAMEKKHSKSQFKAGTRVHPLNDAQQDKVYTTGLMRGGIRL